MHESLYVNSFFFEGGFTQLPVGVPKSMFTRTMCTSFSHLAERHLKDSYKQHLRKYNDKFSFQREAIINLFIPGLPPN